MATKNNPGKFDCYANADPDEPMFVLLGRDKHAAALVRMWAIMRHADGEHIEKVQEAFACAEAMTQYASNIGKSPLSVPDALEVLTQPVQLVDGEV